MAGTPTRGRMGRIQQLPPEIKAYLDRRLREGATQAAVIEETRDMLADVGEPPLSRSGVNRYASRIEAAGRRIREAREVADSWTAKFGEEPTGEVGQHVVELLRVLAFDATLRASDSDDPIDPEDLNNLALAVRRLEAAAETGAKRQRTLRRETASKAATAATAVVRKAGISADTERLIRAAIQGTAE